MTDEAKALVERMGLTLGEWLVDEAPNDWWEYQRDYMKARDLIETQAREIERLREALEREPKAWLIADQETAWVTLFKPNPKDHPWGDVIPLYSAALAGDKHDQRRTQGAGGAAAKASILR